LPCTGARLRRSLLKSETEKQKAGTGPKQALNIMDDLGTGARFAGTQFAALCYRTTPKGAPRILLITSRETGRWVLPKGWPITGKSAAESAAREAFEEAGVEGKVDPHCLGLYSYSKVVAPERAVPCVVAVYPLLVKSLRSRFPERGQRRLRWFSPAKAASKVAEPELAELLARFTPGHDRKSAEASPKPADHFPGGKG
jgi:8-oxo-dGTP pyrophosphatase MutT (NUDIX family)